MPATRKVHIQLLLLDSGEVIIAKTKYKDNKIISIQNAQKIISGPPITFKPFIPGEKENLWVRFPMRNIVATTSPKRAVRINYLKLFVSSSPSPSPSPSTS